MISQDMTVQYFIIQSHIKTTNLKKPCVPLLVESSVIKEESSLILKIR